MIALSSIQRARAMPPVPSTWEPLELHATTSPAEWDLSTGELYLFTNKMKDEDGSVQGQTDGRCIEGFRLHFCLVDQPTVGAGNLDFALENQELIPEAWKQDAGGNRLYVFFSRTVYRLPGGGRVVRFLYWTPWDCWGWGARDLRSAWGINNPNALERRMRA